MEERTVIAPEAAPGGAEATRVIGAPGVAPAMDVTQQAVAVTCPVCGTPNPPGERFCMDCGLLFGSESPEAEPMPDASRLPRLVDPASGRDFFLNPGTNSVGRDAADVLLADPTVSRRHAQLVLEEGRVVVEDLGSTNGTAVSGRPVRPGERAFAYDGDTLRFGSVTLTLVLPGGAARPAQAEAAPAEEERGEPAAFLEAPDGTRHPLYVGLNTIGRRTGNRIVVSDPFMSGRHAEIEIAPDGSAWIVDVGSTNGTFVDGERIEANRPAALMDGLPLRLGKSEFRFLLARPATHADEDAAPGDVPPDDSLAEQEPRQADGEG